MHTFAVVVAKPGREVPPHVRAVLAADDLPELPFVPEAHHRWCDRPGRTVVAGWEVGASLTPAGSAWEARPSGLTAYTGHLWWDARPWPGHRTWAAGLADRLQGRSLADLAPELEGVYAAVAVAPDGTGHVVADPLGVGAVHVAETPDVVVLSTRAALAARLAAPEGGTPARDVEGVGWLVYAANLVDERSPFAGVTLLPQGAVVHLDPSRGARVVAPPSPPWVPEVPAGSLDVRTAAAEVSEHLRRMAATMAGLAPRATLELTGGRDSRLVLALLVAEGLADDLVCATWGPADLPDVRVASAIASRLDLDLRADGHPRRPWRPARPGTASAARATSDPVGAPASGPPEAVPYGDRLRHHVWLTSGALSTFDLARVDRRPTGTVSLTGLLSGGLRTNYGHTSGLRTHDDLVAHLRGGGFRFDGAGLLRPDARRRYDDRVVALFDALRPTARTPQDVVDGFSLSARQRRWLAADHEVETRQRLLPLYSLPAIRRAFAVGSAPRHAQALFFEVMRACSDELASMPFAGRQWPAAAVAGAPDPSRYPTEPAARARPLAATRRRLAPLASRYRRTARRAAAPSPVLADRRRAQEEHEHREVLRELVDLDPGHDLWEVVDRAALGRALDRLPDLPFHARRSLHGAVTAAVWASGAEAPVRRIGEG